MDKQCAVCCKGFGIMSKGKECIDCRMLVCKDHFTKKNLCVRCEIQGIKEKRKMEIRMEIKEIEEEIKKYQSELEQVDHEKYEKVKIIENIEEEMLIKDKNISEELNQVEEELKKLNIQKNKVEENYLQASQELDAVSTALSETRRQRNDIEERNNHLQQQLVVAKEKKQQYGLEIEFLGNKILKGLPADELDPILCDKCKTMIGSEFFPK